MRVGESGKRVSFSTLVYAQRVCVWLCLHAFVCRSTLSGCWLMLVAWCCLEAGFVRVVNERGLRKIFDAIFLDSAEQLERSKCLIPA